MIRESGAVLFATTSYFLERMGLKTLDDLPPLAPHLPEVDELEAELGQLAEAAARSVTRSEPAPGLRATETTVRRDHLGDRACSEGVRLQKVLAAGRNRLSPGVRSPDQRGSRRGQLRAGHSSRAAGSTRSVT